MCWRKGCVVEESARQSIGVCGIDCDTCDFYRFSSDHEAARRVARWFRQMGAFVKSEKGTCRIGRPMRCDGCRGSRKVHWSADCWILRCCVDDRGLDSCWQCDAFPCKQLSEWAESSVRRGHALERLLQMRDDNRGKRGEDRA